MTEQEQRPAGFTLRSFLVGILSIFLTAVLIQFVTVIDAWNPWYGSEAISFAAISVLVVVMLVAGALFAACRVRLLSRPEMLCVLFATLMAAPLTTDAFWRFMLSVSATIPRYEDFEKYDALSPKLWPHGPNLLSNVLEPSHREQLETSGSVEWRELGVNEDRQLPGVVLSNSHPDETSSIRIRLPLTKDGRLTLSLGQPYMVTLLVRARGFGGDAGISCRGIYDDNADMAEEFLSSRKPEKKTYLQKTGFVRLGKYGLVFPVTVEDSVLLEFVLMGKGTVELADLQLMDVSTLESAFIGRRSVTREEYELLPPKERSGLIVEPDTLLSPQGLKFLLAGHIPVRQWIRPILGWAGYIGLLLAGTFCVATIMRRQWVQNERYPMPLAQVVACVLGDEQDDARAVGATWRNRIMWVGFAVMLIWCLMKGWRLFNASAPNISANIPLKAYFTDAKWGKTWDGVTFSTAAIFLSIGLLMDLNILMSLVLGFFFFRFQHWFGESYGLAADRAYPYAEQQQLGAYLSYAVLILVFTRRYLWRVVCGAVRRSNRDEETVATRWALIVLALCFVGVALWARWAHLRAWPMLAFFLCLLSIGLVIAKLRAECGTPHERGTFVPSGRAGAMFLIPLLGGMTFFGPEGIVFVAFVTVLVCSCCFFDISGLQLEFIEMGQRLGLRRRHVVYAAVLGLCGGIVIGGWVYLSSAYAIGADNYPIATGHFSRTGDFKIYNAQMILATRTHVEEETAETEHRGMEPATWGFIYGVAGTVVIAGLRQLFAGFWFHPIGFILGSTDMLDAAWGSFLLAALVRLMVLKLGGAATVRNKLTPFAIGMFYGTAAAYMAMVIIHGWIYFFSPGGKLIRVIF